MRPLREVLVALRRELAAAEMDGHRATVTLAIEVIEKGLGGALQFDVVTGAAGAAASRHSITIELEPRGADGALQDHPSCSKPVPVERAGQSEESGATAKDKGLVELLTGMFGTPGFDNAARASVFADILESLTPDQVAAVVASFESDASEVPLEKPTDPAVAAARTRIARLLRLGPERYRGGLETMLAVLKGTPTHTLIQTVRTTWKTQEAWIDTTTPGVSIQP